MKENSGLIDKSIWAMLEDREDNLWFASRHKGLSKLSSQRFSAFTSKDGLPTNEITQMLELKDGRFLLGAKFGLGLWEKGNFSIVPGMENFEVFALAEAEEGSWYIGTNYDLIKIKDGALTDYTKTPADLYKKVFAIQLDPDGKIWLGTQGGLATLVGDSVVPSPDTIIPKNFVLDIHLDQKGRRWVATDMGVYHMKNRSIEKLKGIDGRVRSIVEEANGTLYFGSNSGLYRWKNEELDVLTTENGLNSNALLGLELEAPGRILALVPKGMDVVDWQDDAVSVAHYDPEDGYMARENQLNAILLDSN